MERWQRHRLAQPVVAAVSGLIAPFRRDGSSDNPAADFAQAIEQHPLLNGELYEATYTTEASATNQEFPHDLGRAYRIVLIMPNDGSLLVPPVSDATDPTTAFVVRPATATAITFTAWIV